MKKSKCNGNIYTCRLMYLLYLSRLRVSAIHIRWRILGWIFIDSFSLRTRARKKFWVRGRLCGIFYTLIIINELAIMCLWLCFLLRNRLLRGFSILYTENWQSKSDNYGFRVSPIHSFSGNLPELKMCALLHQKILFVSNIVNSLRQNKWFRSERIFLILIEAASSRKWFNNRSIWW